MLTEHCEVSAVAAVVASCHQVATGHPLKPTIGELGFEQYMLPQFSGQFWPRLAPELLGLVIGLELVLKILLRWIT